MRPLTLTSQFGQINTSAVFQQTEIGKIGQKYDSCTINSKAKINISR